MARRTTDRAIAPTVITEILSKQVERPCACAVLLRFGHGGIPVQRVVVVIVKLRNDISAAAQGNVVDLSQHVAVVVRAVGEGVPAIARSSSLVINQRATVPSPFIGRTVADANINQLLPVVVMQVVIERRGLHSKRLAAHQARRRLICT